MTDKLPSQAVLAELLRYDPEAGKLYWKERSAKWFVQNGGVPAEQVAKRWNAKWAGKIALDSVHSGGYREGRLFYAPVLAHRVIFKMLHGTEPPQIDHANHDRADNREGNLSAAAYAENSKNRRMRTDNTSGVVGVSRNSERNRWYASIRVGGRTRSLGLYDNLGDAVIARKSAEKRLGFHPNHGAP
jgi:hypothetical protein